MKSKTLTLTEHILDENTILSHSLHTQWNERKTLVLNIMASPGSGKTSLLEQILPLLSKHYTAAVIEGDVVDIDVDRIKLLNIPVVRANTGGACHLDATMIQNVIHKVPKSDVVFIENVGNLICPANFPIGQHKNIVVASVPEGADKPLKYPGMFKLVDAVVLNKIDLLASCDFDLHEFRSNVQTYNKKAQIFPLSCKTGEGANEICQWIEELYTVTFS